MTDGKESDGVWRTIRGRHVFIRKGQSITDAMRESGKFKHGKDGNLLGSIKTNETKNNSQCQININIQLFAANYSKQTDKQLNKSKKSHKRKIEEHKHKLNNPQEVIRDWENYDDVQKKGLTEYWVKEIRNYEQQIKFIDKELEKRKYNNGS